MLLYPWWKQSSWEVKLTYKGQQNQWMGWQEQEGEREEKGGQGTLNPSVAGDWFTPRILITKNYKALFFFKLICVKDSKDSLLNIFAISHNRYLTKEINYAKL